MSDLNGPRRAAKSGAADSLIVFLHGYGANGDDLMGLADPLSGALPNAAFASPHAPEPCRGAPMGRQWFPIPWIDGSAEEERDASFAASVDAIGAYLDAEAAHVGVAPERTALVGFSQGTMMSLHVGLRRTPPLAAIVGFSGMLAAPERLDTEIAARPPILLVHGEADDVIPAVQSRVTANTLAGHGVEASVMMRPGLGHGIDPEGFTAAARFLAQALG